VGRKMAGMCWHVGFLRSAWATLEVVFHYLRRQINRRITFTFIVSIGNICYNVCAYMLGFLRGSIGSRRQLRVAKGCIQLEYQPRSVIANLLHTDNTFGLRPTPNE
jgi:hypothetical protein